MTKTAAVFLFLLTAILPAQVPAERTGSPRYNPFSLPTARGTLRLSASATERLTFGYSSSQSVVSAAGLSANAAFLSPSLLRPSTLVYSGGFLQSTTRQASRFFHNLSVTQAFAGKSSSLNLRDSIRYLPQTPTTGLSGIAGLGDLGSASTLPGQNTLTPYSTQLENTATASVSHRLTGKSAVQVTGNYTLQRFIDSPNGIDTDQYLGSGSLQHRIDARSSFSGAYSYVRFSYVGFDVSLLSQAVIANYRRQMTRKLLVDLALGPQWTGASRFTGRGPALNYTADARLAYTGSSSTGSNLSLNYTRSTNSGSGTAFGATRDSATLTAGRRIGRSLHVATQVNYAHSSGLRLLTPLPLNADTVVGSLQANRILSRTLSAYVGYTAQGQSTTGVAQGLSPLTGFSQILAFGLTYSPASMHVGHR